MHLSGLGLQAVGEPTPGDPDRLHSPETSLQQLRISHRASVVERKAPDTFGKLPIAVQEQTSVGSPTEENVIGGSARDQARRASVHRHH